MSKGETKKRFPCIEKTFEYRVGDLEIRLWVNAEAVEIPSRGDTDRLFPPKSVIESSYGEIVEWYQERTTELNAIQIRRGSLGEGASGVVVYLVEFTDLKG